MPGKWPKKKFRAFSVLYCVPKINRQALKNSLEKYLENLQETLDSNPSHQSQDLYDSNENKLEKIEKEEINRQIFRSKQNGQKRGKNSTYFLSLEKRNYTNKLISTLEMNGNIIKDPIKISEVLNQFFKTLYAETLNQNDPNYQDSLDECLLNKDMSKLTVQLKEACNKPINESEILKSITNLSNGKTPGSDGLPSDLLTHSIIYAM